MRCATVLGAMVLGCSTAMAGPLDVDLVPSNAQWVVHVDMEAIAESTLAQAACKGLELDEQFQEMQAEGMDPFKEMRSITLYGWGKLEEHNMVIVADANRKVAELIAYKAGEEGISGRVDGDWTFYSAPDNINDFSIAVLNRDEGVRIFVAGNEDGVVKAAAGRAGGERASVIGNGPGKGALIYAAAKDLAGVVPDWNGSKPHSHMVNSTEALMVELSETDGVVRGRLHATCADTQTSEDAVELLQGMKALGRMMARENEELRPLVELSSALKIRSEGSVVQIEVEAPTALLEMLIDSAHEHHGEDSGY